MSTRAYIKSQVWLTTYLLPLTFTLSVHSVSSFPCFCRGPTCSPPYHKGDERGNFYLQTPKYIVSGPANHRKYL